MAINIVNRLMLFLIFLVPLVSCVTQPLFYNSIFMSLLGLCLVYAVLSHKMPPADKSVMLPAVLFLAYLVIPVLFSKNPLVSARYLFEFSVCVACFLVFSNAANDLKRKVVFVVILSSFFVSLYAIYQHFASFALIQQMISENKTILYGVDTAALKKALRLGRAVSTFPSGNLLSAYLAMTGIVSIGYISDMRAYNKRFFLIVVVLAANITAAYFSYSLSGAVCFAAGFLMFLAFVIFKKQEFFKKYLLWFIIQGVAIFALLAAMCIKWHDLSATLNYHLVNSIQYRLAAWKPLLAALRDNPFQFLGPGNYRVFSGNEYSIFVHNIFLQLWIESGITGLIIFVWLIISVYKKALRNLSSSGTRPYMQIGLIAAAFAFLLQNMAEFSFFIAQAALIWWILFALMAADDTFKV
ncbi:MAG: O-antigen ligase family protein [Candidatus Omnitrophica bacterium]|nr:O-antigen ligase family protein [Candidatus Omnitrophota bacterium]